MINDDINELKGRISAYKNLIRVTKSDMENEEYVTRTIKEHKERIAWHEKMIQNIVYRKENGADIIKNAHLQLRKLAKALVILEHKRELEKAKKLIAEINKLQKEINENRD